MEKIILSANERGRIRKSNLKKLEKLLDVTLELFKDSAIVKSNKDDSFAEYISAEIIKAVGFGFNLGAALQLRDTECIFRKIDIKAGTKKTGMTVARIIGTRGKTKKTFEKISQCSMALEGHVIAIIGKSENVELANKAILAIIRGAPSAKVLGRLEKDMASLAEEDIEKYIEK